MRGRPSVLLATGVAATFVVVAACADGSSGGGSSNQGIGFHPAESGSATLSAQSGSCGIFPEFDINAQVIARLADRTGIGTQSTPTAALHAVLTHGSVPYFGGRGGSGVVGWGFPATGWKEVSATGDQATFRAPLHSGTARLTFTRVGSRWLLSHLEKDC